MATLSVFKPLGLSLVFSSLLAFLPACKTRKFSDTLGKYDEELSGRKFCDDVSTESGLPESIVSKLNLIFTELTKTEELLSYTLSLRNESLETRKQIIHEIVRCCPSLQKKPPQRNGRYYSDTQKLAPKRSADLILSGLVHPYEFILEKVKTGSTIENAYSSYIDFLASKEVFGQFEEVAAGDVFKKNEKGELKKVDYTEGRPAIGVFNVTQIQWILETLRVQESEFLNQKNESNFLYIVGSVLSGRGKKTSFIDLATTGSFYSIININSAMKPKLKEYFGNGYNIDIPFDKIEVGNLSKYVEVSPAHGLITATKKYILISRPWWEVGSVHESEEKFRNYHNSPASSPEILKSLVIWNELSEFQKREIMSGNWTHFAKKMRYYQKTSV